MFHLSRAMVLSGVNRLSGCLGDRGAVITNSTFFSTCRGKLILLWHEMTLLWFEERWCLVVRVFKPVRWAQKCPRPKKREPLRHKNITPVWCWSWITYMIWTWGRSNQKRVKHLVLSYVCTLIIVLIMWLAAWQLTTRFFLSWGDNHRL